MLDRLLELDPAIVVPGHGEVGGASLIREARDYMTLVQSETARLAAAGLDVDAVVERLEPELRARYADWGSPEWIGFAIRCFFAALPA